MIHRILSVLALLSLLYLNTLCANQISKQVTILTNESSSLTIAENSNQSIAIYCPQKYIYLETSSCQKPLITFRQQDTIVNASRVLSPWSSVYMCSAKNTSLVTLDATKILQPFNLTIFSVADLSQLPYHSQLVKVDIGDEYLHVSFSSVKVPGTKSAAKYSTWFVKPGYRLRCTSFSEYSVEEVPGMVQSEQIPDETQSVAFKIPLNGKYPKDSSLIYEREEEIRGMVNRNEQFFVGILAELGGPFRYTLLYNPVKVERKLDIIDLKIGFLILLIGVLVFGAISCIYLFCRRRFGWQHDEFQEQIELEEAQSKVAASNGVMGEEKHTDKQ